MQRLILHKALLYALLFLAKAPSALSHISFGSVSRLKNRYSDRLLHLPQSTESAWDHAPLVVGKRQQQRMCTR